MIYSNLISIELIIVIALDEKKGMLHVHSVLRSVTSTFVNGKYKEIKNRGRWSLTCFELYIRIN